MTARHLRDGAAAEQLARSWLEQRGLQTLASNFRCKAGELDLVMLEGDCIVVVEVRYRATETHGGPLHSITVRKQRRLLRATRRFLQVHSGFAAHALRFDVMAITGKLESPTLRWQQRAFDAGGNW